MPQSAIRQHAQLAVSMRAFLSEPLQLDRALGDLRDRLETRENCLLETMRQLVYGNAVSPYRALLRWAGCEVGDLERLVGESGVEGTLETLRDAGVSLSLDEFKGRRPIVRPGLTIETTPSDFDNPIFLGRGIAGGTSGTSGRSRRVFLDWDGLAEECANEAVLFALHGLVGAPLALLLPPPPGLAGIRNVFVHAKLGRPPARWFSPTAPPSRRHRLATYGLIAGCRLFAGSAPRPEVVEPEQVGRVASWLAEGSRDHPRVLSAFTSSAVRVADSAAAHGVDLTGNVVFATGEPLTAHRRRHIERTGLRAYSRYVAAETGMVAAGCWRGAEADGMHLYVDRVAAITHEEADEGTALLLTTLSSKTPKVLVNVDLGDRFRIDRKPCDCLFGMLGMDVHISDVRSSQRLTGEGATVLVAELEEIVAALVENAGGAPDDFQFSETLDDSAKVAIVVRPRVRITDARLIEGVLEELSTRGPIQRMTADLWRRSETLSVVRGEPQAGTGAKQPPFVSAGSLGSVVRRR